MAATRGAKGKGKSPPKTPKAAQAAPMRKPRTGKGLLRTGNPGNAGGAGRPASAIREHLRGSFADRIKTLEQIADGEALVKMKGGDGVEVEMLTSAEVSDRLKALDMMAKFGLGKDVSLDDVKAKLKETLDVIDEECAPETAARIRERLRSVWR